MNIFSRRRRERNAIATLAIGQADYFPLTLPTLHAYAARIQVPLILLRERVLPDCHLCFEKAQVAALLRDYDRILYLDSDLVVTEHAPDIFQLPIPRDHFAAVIDKSDEAIRERPDELSFEAWGNHDYPALEKLFGPIGKPRDQLFYCNTGVMLLGRKHRRCLEALRTMAHDVTAHAPLFKSTGEQSALNYLANKMRFPWHPLEKRWNRIYGHHDPSPAPRESFIVHYAGTGAKRREILRDFPWLAPFARTNPFGGAPAAGIPADAEVPMDRCHLDLVYGLLVSRKPHKILELGMGSGAVTDLFLAAADYNLQDSRIGCVDNWLDWNGRKPDAIAAYEQRGIRVITSAERDFVLSCHSTFDVIVSDGDHFRAEQWFDETLRLLAPGGLLIYHDVTNVITPNLAAIVSETRRRNLPHLLLRTSSRADERCERGLLVIQNPDEANDVRKPNH